MKTWHKLVFPPAMALCSWGCGSSNASSSLASPGFSAGGCPISGCTTADASISIGGSTSSVIHGNDVDASTTTWSPLCGPEDAGCLPDSDSGTCEDIYELDPEVDAGDADAADAMADAGALTCRIRSVTDAIMRTCEVSGAGGSGAPCRTPTDCGTGLTCVVEDLVSLCRPYCCADAETCPNNTYCATRTTLVDKDSWTLGSDVPVCTPAENCRLSDAYPCPTGTNCSCAAGKACMIVRRLGLTACVKPGSGMQGDYCPCAAGYVCSNATFTCLKLCQLTSNSQTSQGVCNMDTSCQASNDVPTDWGVCNDKPLLMN